MQSGSRFPAMVVLELTYFLTYDGLLTMERRNSMSTMDRPIFRHEFRAVLSCGCIQMWRRGCGSPQATPPPPTHTLIDSPNITLPLSLRLESSIPKRTTFDTACACGCVPSAYGRTDGSDAQPVPHSTFRLALLMMPSTTPISHLIRSFSRGLVFRKRKLVPGVRRQW